jgi:4'-phosphopantetheinyl transferase EntD
MTAAAAVTRSTTFQSIGLDLETAEALTPEIVAMVCRPTENADGDGAQAKLLFCIKESIYKCLYPVIHSYIDFLEMEVLYDRGTHEFAAISHSASCPAELAARLEGRFKTEFGYVISAAWLK